MPACLREARGERRHRCGGCSPAPWRPSGRISCGRPCVGPGGHRIDVVDGAARRPQAGDQEPAGGLDGHGDGILRRVAVLGEHPQQPVEPFRCVIDASPREQCTRFVDDGYVVVVAGPVNAAERSHSPHASSSDLCCCWSQPCRVCVSLMEGLSGPTSDLPFMTPATGGALGLDRSWMGLETHKR